MFVVSLETKVTESEAQGLQSADSLNFLPRGFYPVGRRP